MPTGKQRERNRERVIEVARDCFLKDGLEAVQLRTVAERAGVAVRSVERYFHGRYGLLEATGLAIAKQSFQELRDYVATQEFKAMRGRDQLMTLLRHRLERCLSHYETVICIIELEVYAFRHGESKTLFRHMRESLRDIEEVIGQCLDKGLADGSIVLRVNRQKFLDTLIVDFNGFIMRMAFVQAEEEGRERLRHAHARAVLKDIERILAGQQEEFHAPDVGRP